MICRTITTQKVRNRDGKALAVPLLIRHAEGWPVEVRLLIELRHHRFVMRFITANLL